MPKTGILKRVGRKLLSMKKASILLLATICSCIFLKAQVTVETFPLDPQSGSHNYFGVRVTLTQTYSNNVTVTGFVYDEGGGANTNNPFSLTVTTGNLTAETAANFYQTDPTASATAEIGTIVVIYAGVSVTYEVNNNILKFSSFSDANAVLNQLDEDYEDNYDNYDSQLDTSLSVEILDSIDEANGFNPRITYINFENLFPGFSSKRAQIASVESTWLANDLSGTHPADIDLIFDDAQNTICNTNYSFKIGNDLYELTSNGTYINGTLHDPEGSVAKNHQRIEEKADLQAGQNRVIETSGPSIPNEDNSNMTVCKSNKKDQKPFKYDNETKRFELEVAIRSIVLRSGIHGKVIHFKKKNNGNWKRSRAQMAAIIAGKIYSGDCTYLDLPSDRQPNNGFKKREEQKARIHSEFQIPGNSTIWKTYSGEVAAAFESPVGSGTLVLTF
jgi:hypothetical protein